MEGSDVWSSRLTSSSSSSRRYQLRSGNFGLQTEAFFGGDDVETEDDQKQEYSCPFCVEEFDMVGLFCHIDDKHPMEVKQGVCPVCAKRVGLEMVSHITLQHANILKVPRRRRLRKGLPNSMFNILRKELREGNRQSFFGGSPFALSSSSSSNPDSDPLLSSFIYSSPSAEEVGKDEPHSSKSVSTLPQTVEKSNVDSGQPPLLSREDHQEKTRRCEFVQSLLSSTMLDDTL